MTLDFLTLPYSSPIFWSLPMIILLLCELLADFLGKQWTLRKRNYLFAASIAMYVIGNSFWIIAVLNGVGLARGSLIFSVGQEMAAVMMGLFYFKEKLFRRQKIGILLGILTIIIMG